MVSVAQVQSSKNMGCTVGAKGGMTCNGTGAPDAWDKRQTRQPTLSTVHYTLEPGPVLSEPNSDLDCLIVGINGGSVLNEEWPSRHVSLDKDEVTLLPKEQPFRLRNVGPTDVEFRMIAIER
jgi:hypothetical protein